MVPTTDVELPVLTRLTLDKDKHCVLHHRDIWLHKRELWTPLRMLWGAINEAAGTVAAGGGSSSSSREAAGKPEPPHRS